jgi:hypothetical protein
MRVKVQPRGYTLFAPASPTNNMTYGDSFCLIQSTQFPSPRDRRTFALTIRNTTRSLFVSGLQEVFFITEHPHSRATSTTPNDFQLLQQEWVPGATVSTGR